VSESHKSKRAQRRAQRREERDKRTAKSSSKGAGRPIWLAAIGAAVIGIVAIGIFSFGLSGQDATTTAGAGANSRDSSTAGRFPIVAYPRGIPAIGSPQRDFTELLGTGQPVVLNFWAGQCPPCRAEMPAFQSVYDTHGDDFLLVGVDVGPFIGLGTTQSAIDLLAELGITYPTARALDARAVQDHNILSMPTTIFYDGEGVEVARQSGVLSEDMLGTRVRDLIEAQAG
jgi:thiol-disulfide isomerase/thioredoxin